MPIDFSELVLAPCMAAFAFPLIVLPVASRPGTPSYDGVNGIWSEEPVVIETATGFHSTNEPTLGIRYAEWDCLKLPHPLQKDLIKVCDPGTRYPWWAVIDVIPDGQGGAKLKLRGQQSTIEPQ